MPTLQHEVPLELLREDPELALHLLRDVLEVDVPSPSMVALGSEALPTIAPTELTCDATVLLDDLKRPSLVIIMEVQQVRDPKKPSAWACYVSNAWHRYHQCDVFLMVICPTTGAARWCSRPIDVGNFDWVLTPRVVDLSALPAVTDLQEAAATPALAILSAPAHGDGPNSKEVLTAVAEALQHSPPTVVAAYHAYVEQALSPSARTLLEVIMKSGQYDYVSSIERRGEAKGVALSILRLLDKRGIPVPKAVRSELLQITDTGHLDQLFDRALTVQNADDLFT